jgi:WD40 repeat protein
VQILKNPGGPAWHLAFSPDSKWLLVVRDTPRLAELPSGDFKPVPAAGAKAKATFAGGSLLTLGEGELRVIDPATKESQRSVPLGEAKDAGTPAFSRAGLVAAAGGLPLAIHLWSWPKLEAIPPVRGEHVRDSWPTIELSADGRWLAMRGNSQVVALHDLVTGKLAWEATPAGLAGWHALTFSPDGTRLAVGSGRHLTVLDIADGQVVASQELAKKYFRGIAYTPDGRFLAAVSHEETVKVYDPSTLALRHELAWGIGKLEHVAFSADGMLGAATGGKKAVVWDMDW